MLKTQRLCKVLFKTNWKNFALQAKEISVFYGLQKKMKFPDYLDAQGIKSDLWFTTLPSTKKRAISLNKYKVSKLRSKPLHTGEVIIKCKNKNLNHHRGTYYGKFDVIPLASKSWHSRKSKGDEFTILPTSEHQAFNFPALDGIPHSFEEAGVCDEIIKQLCKMQIHIPTVVQAKTIPQFLKGEQLLVAAETGSGKTLAYLIPVVQKVLELKKNKNIETKDNSPLAVVLVNTRELSMQVGGVARDLCSGLGLKCLTIIGGSGSDLVTKAVYEPVDVVVSTLGVLLKLIKNEVYFLDSCKYLVVDEADSLLDDSFSSGLKSIFRRSKLTFSPPQTQNVLENSAQLCMVSATMPTSIKTFGDFLPVEFLHKITTDYLHKIQPHIPQVFMRTGKTSKPETLLRVVNTCASEKLPTMIFCNTTKTCNWVAYFLNERGIKAVRVNAQMYPESRLVEFEKFKSGQVNFLCCTDVSSRGLDCTTVKRIINYEFPKYMADYIHRCGRTGRIGHTKNCKIINFVSKINEAALVNEIEKAVRTQREFPNVNNNIKRIIKFRASKYAAGTSLSGTVTMDPDADSDDNQAQVSA